jgi:hypothetical protein
VIGILVNTVHMYCVSVMPPIQKTDEHYNTDEYDLLLPPRINIIINSGNASPINNITSLVTIIKKPTIMIQIKHIAKM